MSAVLVEVGGTDGKDFVMLGHAPRGYRLAVRQFGSHVDIDLSPAQAGEVVEALIRLGAPLNDAARAALERSSH